MTEISLVHLLVVSLVLFVLGLATTLVRRGAVGALMGVLVMFGAAALCCSAFGRTLASREAEGGHGHLLALLLLIVATALTAAVLAIVLTLHRRTGSTDLDDATALSG
jgi:NADH-quinone oxidoreductase subunit K